jgi:predicted dithiol-disulfide oxidoreductase (DUF899 family)
MVPREEWLRLPKALLAREKETVRLPYSIDAERLRATRGQDECEADFFRRRDETRPEQPSRCALASQ